MPHDTAPTIRLNKAIAASGLCSRRKADQLIFAGRVAVNDEQEKNPARQVVPSDSISVDGKVLSIQQDYSYLLLHKPVQVLCTMRDPEGRPTVVDFLPPEARKKRVYPVGRLDYFSEGLILLTNDGQLAQRMMHPRYQQAKRYEVLVRGPVTQKALQIMRHGMRLAEGDQLLPVEVTALPHGRDTELHMLLRQGLNRQIRRMCRDLGLTILRLCRVAQGPLQLGDLPAGAVRPLLAGEISQLRKSVGLS
jgi:23S rRNA pseudouridine2605 synthase